MSKAIPLTAVFLVALVIGSISVSGLQAKTDKEYATFTEKVFSLPFLSATDTVVNKDTTVQTTDSSPGSAVSSDVLAIEPYPYPVAQPGDIQEPEPLPMPPVAIIEPVDQIDFDDLETQKSYAKDLPRTITDAQNALVGPITTRVMTSHDGTNMVIMQTDESGHFTAHHYYITNGKIIDGAKNIWGQFTADPVTGQMLFFGFVAKADLDNFVHGKTQDDWFVVSRLNGHMMYGQFKDFPA